MIRAVPHFPLHDVADTPMTGLATETPATRFGSAVTVGNEDSSSSTGSESTITGPRATQNGFSYFNRTTPKWHHARNSAYMYLACDYASSTNPDGDPLFSICRGFTEGKLSPRPSGDWVEFFHELLGFRFHVMAIANGYKNDLGLRHLPVCEQFDIQAYHREAIALADDHNKVLEHLSVKRNLITFFPEDPFLEKKGVIPFIPRIAIFLAAGLFIHHNCDMAAITNAMDRFGRIREQEKAGQRHTSGWGADPQSPSGKGKRPAIDSIIQGLTAGVVERTDNGPTLATFRSTSRGSGPLRHYESAELFLERESTSASLETPKPSPDSVETSSETTDPPSDSAAPTSKSANTASYPPSPADVARKLLSRSPLNPCQQQ